MAIRVNFEIRLQLSETTQDSQELGKTAPWRGVNDQQINGGTFLQRITAGATDVLIDLNGLANATMVAIKSSEEITVKKNSAGGEPWTIKPLGIGALDGVMVITTDGVTSLFVSNPGAVDANVTFAFAGDS